MGIGLCDPVLVMGGAADPALALGDRGKVDEEDLQRKARKRAGRAAETKDVKVGGVGVEEQVCEGAVRA